ncbi:MAG: hypothetical protein FWG09_06970, partial [Synergistaceae bacterium]|nr:hypothetical protein [Synergistaceae bacterium]
ALANIGKTDLSSIALKLEQSGRDKNIGVIAAETPPFLDSLRAFVGMLTPKEETAGSEAADEDRQYLHEKLLVIITACEEYDKDAAGDALAEIRGKTWSQPTKELLGAISEHLLHSDFDEAIDAIKKFMEA